jgi:hypothetical protein
MESPVDESGRSRSQRIDALLGEKDRVAGGFGELLDAGCHVDRVADEGELELAAAMRFSYVKPLPVGKAGFGFGGRCVGGGR